MQQQSQWSSSGSLTRLFKVKLCTACVSPLGRILSRGGHCPKCGLRVCKNCRHYDVSGGQVSSNWICILCSGSPPNYNAGTLPKSGGVGKSTKSIIRRSWTISNPQRGSAHENSPILKSYTIYNNEILNLNFQNFENNVVSNSRQFNSLPRLNYGQSMQDENQRKNVRQRVSIKSAIKSSDQQQEMNYSTLHPFKNNNKSNSNSSVNNLELFWDYYDYNIINSSNRSSCERSLGETEYCVFSNVIDTGEQNQNNSQNINPNPNGSTGGTNNNKANLGGANKISSSSGGGNLSTTTISPVKPERSNKRSNSLNSYDGKKLSFSPLRTYVVLRQQPSQQPPTITKKRSSSFNLEYCGGKRNRANSSSESSSDIYPHDVENFDDLKRSSQVYSDVKRPFSENHLNCNGSSKVSIQRPDQHLSNFKRNILLDLPRRESSESDKLVTEFIKEPLVNLKRSVVSQNFSKKLDQQQTTTTSTSARDCDSTDFPFNSIPKRKPKVNGDQVIQDNINFGRWDLPPSSDLSALDKYHKQQKSMLVGKLAYIDQCGQHRDTKKNNNIDNKSISHSTSSTNNYSSSLSPQSKQAKYFHHKQVENYESTSSSNNNSVQVQCPKVSTTTSGLHRIVKPPRKILANKTALSPLPKSPLPSDITCHRDKVSSNPNQQKHLMSTTLPKSYKSRPHEYKNENFVESEYQRHGTKSTGSSPDHDPGLENLLKKSEKILNPGLNTNTNVNVMQINQTFPRRKQLKTKELPSLGQSEKECAPHSGSSGSNNNNNHNNNVNYISSSGGNNSIVGQIKDHGHHNESSSSNTSSSCEELVLSAYDDDDDDDENVKEIESVEGITTVGGGWVYKKLKGDEQQQVCDGSVENQVLVRGANNLKNESSKRLTDLTSQYAHDARDFLVSDNKNKQQSTGGQSGSHQSQLHIHQSQEQPVQQQQFRNLRIIKGRSSNEFVTTVQINNDMCHEPILNPILRIDHPVSKPDIISPHHPHPHHNRRQFERPSASSLDGRKIKASVPVTIPIELEKNPNKKFNSSQLPVGQLQNNNNNNNNSVRHDQVEEQTNCAVKLPRKIETNNIFDVHSNSHATSYSNDDDTFRYTKSTISSENGNEFVNVSSPFRNHNNYVEENSNSSGGVSELQSLSVREPLNQFSDRDSASAASTENSSDDTIIDCSQYNNNNCQVNTSENINVDIDSASDTLVDVQNNELVIELQRRDQDSSYLLSSGEINNHSITTTFNKDLDADDQQPQQQETKIDNDVTPISVPNNKSIQEFLTVNDDHPNHNIKGDKDIAQNLLDTSQVLINTCNFNSSLQQQTFEEEQVKTNLSTDSLTLDSKEIDELPVSHNSTLADNWDEEGILQQRPPCHSNTNVVIDLASREIEPEGKTLVKLNSTKEFEQLCDSPETRDNENLLELLHIFHKTKSIENEQQVYQLNFPQTVGSVEVDIEQQQQRPEVIDINNKAHILKADVTSQQNFFLLPQDFPSTTTTLMTGDFEETQQQRLYKDSLRELTEPKPDEITQFFDDNDNNQVQIRHPSQNNNSNSMNVMMMEHNERLTPEGQESFTDDSNTTKRSSPDGEAITGMSKLDEENFQVTSSDSDNSWIEEIPYEEGPPPLDLTLHTIVEESCEESCDEAESLKLGQSSSSRKPVDELENYFNYLDPASESRKLANEDSEFSDTFSESSFNSEVHQHLGNEDSMMMMDPVDLASTRLEKYFTNLSYNNNPEPYSEDSVGSESESDDHIIDKKKKVLKHKRSSNVSDDESIFDLDEGNFDTIKKLPKKKMEKQQHSHHHQSIPQTTDNLDGDGDDRGMDYGSGGSSGAFPTTPTPTPTTTKSKQVLLNRSNSFQWSSDEEVNLMMSKLRHLIKNLMQKNQTTSIETNSQLRYFTDEIERLMRSEPELKNIVSEYISSEESDDNEFNQFIKDVVEQQQQQQPNESKYSPSSTWNKPTSSIPFPNDPQQQQQQLSLGPNSSPALIAKVMHHIGKRLSDWMKDEEDEDGTLKCAPSVSSDLNEDRFSWKGSFESTLAAKRQSVGSTDSISSSDFNNQHQAAVCVDRSILRSSSLHHLANSQPIEEKKEEEENISNSLPRLNQMTNMPRAQSTKEIRVKSARYRPPGFTQAPSIIKQIDDKMSMSTPAINIHQDHSPDTPLNLRSSADSISSMFEHGPGVNIRGQIEFSLQYNYKLASLEVRIKQCRDLAETKRNRADPYVKAYLLPDRSKSGKRKTKTKKNTLNPIFEETLKFPLTLSELQSRTLWVSVWHSDIFGKNEFLGQVLINLKDRVFDDPRSVWWSLEEMSVQVEDQSRGDLILALKWQPRGENRGALSILVKEAKNIYLLPTKNGCPSTFVKCSPLKEVNKNHRTKQKTSIARRTVHPVWNQTLYFEDIPDEGVEVSLWNYDLLSNHDLIGSVKLDYTVPLWESMLNRHSFWVEGVLKLDSGISS